jgi:putative SOS response-associated peptidase YedK
MCNRYGYLAPVTQLTEAFSLVGLPILFPPGGVPNLPPRETIRPTDQAPILRPAAAASPRDGLTLAEARWWLIPFFYRGPIKDWKAMCTNARAETAATARTFREPFKSRRCLAPASYYFEWTGPKGGKTMWRFSRRELDLFCFAGLWDRAETEEGPVESFTLLTRAAGPDTLAYHNREPVTLSPDQWARWLDLEADPAPLLAPSAAGTLTVERAA